MIFFNKIKQPDSKKTFTSGLIIFILIVALLLLKFLYPTSSRIAWEKDNYQTRFDKLVEKESWSINDSLPHYQYKRLQDSIRRQLSEENIPRGGSGSMSVFDVGVGKIEFQENKVKYYLTVGGYFAKDFFEFYSLHGKNYIEYSVFTKKENDFRVGDFKTAETKFELEQLDQNRWQINYPLSKTQYTVWQAIVIVLSFLAVGLLFMALIGLPLQLLFLIAKGKAFSDKVLIIFYTIASILLCSGIFLAIFRITLHLYYKAQVPYPVTFYYYDDIMNGWSLVIGGLIVLLFAKAFQRGYDLQQEQELTV